MSSDSPRRAIVLGALSAMAEETCRLLAEDGASLSLFGRDTTRLEEVARDLRARGAKSVEIRAGDLADASNAAAELRTASDAIGGANAVLIFYGVLGDQKLAEQDTAEAARILDVNFTSAAHWALAAANLIEQAGEDAVLLGVSSVAGDRGRRSNYVYGAAKGGFSILLQGIAHRFAALPHAPRAVVVKAGFVDSPMTAGIKKGGPLWATPKQIAQDICRALDHGGPIVYAPGFWRFVMLAIRMTPNFVFKRINL